MLERRFHDLPDQLQSKKPHFPDFLAGVHLEGIRGIADLPVEFDYPVGVIAGGNASGKSTVLFAAACAYRVPGAGVKDFVPSPLFPYYRPKSGVREGERWEITLEFDRVRLFHAFRAVLDALAPRRQGVESQLTRQKRREAARTGSLFEEHREWIERPWHCRSRAF